MLPHSGRSLPLLAHQKEEVVRLVLLPLLLQLHSGSERSRAHQKKEGQPSPPPLYNRGIGSGAMHAPNAVRLRVVTTIFLALGAVPTLAQYVENFTGSLQIVNGQGTYSGTSSGGSGGWSESGSPAVQAQCPANFPVTCSSIQKPD